MTEPVVFGSLQPVPLREAWTHEALAFTPWLAANIGLLSAAIGIQLEVTDTEVAVEAFAADIVAHNQLDGSIVLIENQLEPGDHRHLGQIMTYLAGLNAQTIIWIASEFRDPHLSAIRWLNKNTDPAFAFFAVRLRVVRIGGSPLAPVFDVLEKPNDWERTLHEAAQASGELTEVGKFRREFWTFFLEHHPEEAAYGRAKATPSRWRMLPSGVVVAQYFAEDAIGVFIRGGKGVAIEKVLARLAPFKVTLEPQLGAAIAIGSYSFIAEKKRIMITKDKAKWPEMAEWLHSEANSYASALNEILGVQS